MGVKQRRADRAGRTNMLQQPGGCGATGGCLPGKALAGQGASERTCLVLMHPTLQPAPPRPASAAPEDVLGGLGGDGGLRHQGAVVVQQEDPLARPAGPASGGDGGTDCVGDLAGRCCGPVGGWAPWPCRRPPRARPAHSPWGAQALGTSAARWARMQPARPRPACVTPAGAHPQRPHTPGCAHMEPGNGRQAAGWPVQGSRKKGSKLPCPPTAGRP